MDLCFRPWVLGVLLVSVALVQSVSAQNLTLQFVNVSLCFEGAQQWCEDRGGHLAYITHPLIQEQLKTVLEPHQDAWIGLRRNWTTDLTWNTFPDPWAQHLNKGLNYGFFWLDEYPLHFFAWTRDGKHNNHSVLNPDLRLNQSFHQDCTMVLGETGHRWAMTSDCERELPFVCQYGAEHYEWTQCQRTSIPCDPNHQLVIDQLYLIQDYRRPEPECSPSFLLPQAQDRCNCSNCSLPVQALSDCSASLPLPTLFYYYTPDQNVTIDRCYSGSEVFSPWICSALYNHTLDIELTAVLTVEAWVTMDSCGVSMSSISWGKSTDVMLIEANLSANITIPYELLPSEGCYNLTLHYRTNDTLETNTTHLQVYLWKPLVRLQVQVLDSILTFGLLALNVSVDHGNPAQIMFYVRTYDWSSNWTFIETEILNKTHHIYFFNFSSTEVKWVKVVVINPYSILETEKELCHHNHTVQTFTHLNQTTRIWITEAFREVLQNFSIYNECPNQIDTTISRFLTLIETREVFCNETCYKSPTNLVTVRASTTITDMMHAEHETILSVRSTYPLAHWNTTALLHDALTDVLLKFHIYDECQDQNNMTVSSFIILIWTRELLCINRTCSNGSGDGSGDGESSGSSDSSSTGNSTSTSAPTTTTTTTAAPTTTTTTAAPPSATCQMPSEHNIYLHQFVNLHPHGAPYHHHYSHPYHPHHHHHHHQPHLSTHDSSCVHHLNLDFRPYHHYIDHHLHHHHVQPHYHLHQHIPQHVQQHLHQHIHQHIEQHLHQNLDHHLQEHVHHYLQHHVQHYLQHHLQHYLHQKLQHYVQKQLQDYTHHHLHQYLHKYLHHAYVTSSHEHHPYVPYYKLYQYLHHLNVFDSQPHSHHPLVPVYKPPYHHYLHHPHHPVYKPPYHHYLHHPHHPVYKPPYHHYLYHPHHHIHKPPYHHYVHHIHHNHGPTNPATPPPFSFNWLHCSFNPPTGTVFRAFIISCTAPASCPNLKYCFSTLTGKSLGCSSSSVTGLFLPQGAPLLSINVTATYGQFHVSSIVTVEVTEYPDCLSLESAQISALSNVSLLQSQNQLTAEALGQLLISVGELLNCWSDPKLLEQRQQFRDTILELLLNILLKSLVSTPCPRQIHALNFGLINLIQTHDFHCSSIVQKATEVLLKLSRRLLQTLSCPDFHSTVLPAAESIILAGNILMGLNPEQSLQNDLMVVLENAQTALLQASGIQPEPTVINQGQTTVMVHRVTPQQLQALVSIPNSFGPWFDLQNLPLKQFRHEPLVDIRMVTLQHNPYSWKTNRNISPTFVSLKLTTPTGISISVRDLRPEFQIFFPNLNTNVFNATILDLRNFSTLILYPPMAQSSLLIKMIPSEDPLPFKVYLGEKHPSDSAHLVMTDMPRPGRTLAERYSWLVDASVLKGTSKELFLLVRPVVGPGIKSINASLSITPMGTSCNFWDESKQDWSTAGCRVGPHSTFAVTHCLCDHLTVFGRSFFVVPNLVDPSRSAELFGTFTENPVVVCLIIALFLAYILALIWARYKDLRDTTKVKVTALADNEPSDRYQYLVTVRTGYRRGAATSSKVTLVLMGSSSSSAPHHLSDSRKPLFQRGATDMFILKTPSSLGHLQGIRLWHNNSGGHPDWFVSSVTVQDLQTMEKSEVLCNSWISVDFGDDGLHQHFLVSTEEELKRFRHLFVTKFSRDFCDGHLWYSVVHRPPSSTFSRVQRLSCCFSLLLCTMLTSIMFYGIPTDPSEQVMDLGHFEFTFQQFMIGVQSCLIMFPINFLIVSLFRFSRPRNKTCCGPRTCCGSHRSCLAEFFCGPLGVSKPDQDFVNRITKKVTKTIKSLSKATKESKSKSRIITKHEKDVGSVLTELEDYIFQRNLHRAQAPESGEKPSVCNENTLFSELCRLENQLSAMAESELQRAEEQEEGDLKRAQEHKGHDLQRPEASRYSSLLHWVRELKDRLTETSSVHVYSLPSSASRKRALPWWCVIVGWFLVVGSSCVCGYFTMLYGLKFGKEKSISWLVSMFVSFFQSLLVTQPLKVVGMALFFALVMKKLKDDEMLNVYIYHDIGQKDLSLYEPPPAVDIEKMRMKRQKEKKAHALITEILVYLGFLWMLLLVAYGQRDPNSYYLNQHILKSFKPAPNKTRSQTIQIQNPSMNLDQIFQWAKTTLLPNLYGQYPGFITDGNSRLVGVARVRQVRVIGPSCQPPEYVHFPKDCNPSYSWRWEDTGSYGPQWTPPSNGTGLEQGPWIYQTQEQLRGAAMWGRNLLYRGGGYVAELGPDLHNASSTLQYLYSERWLDSMTRAVFVEFTVYNANVNLFCIVTLLFETSAAGAFEFVHELRTLRLYASTGGLYAFVMFGEILYIIFILYYMYLQFKAIQKQRWSYFRNKWNLVELSIIVLSWTGVGVFAHRTLLGQRDIAFYQNNKDKFAGFYSTAVADAVLQYVIAFVVLLATVKLWHLLRLNPNMNLISSALSRAAGDISGFILVIALLLIAFASACNTLYGWQMASYRTFSDSLITLIKLQLGIFNYAEVLDYSPVLGAFLIGSCIILMGFVVLNLLISVILVAFNEEQIHHKASDEEEIVQMMMKKVFSLFGLNYKTSPMEQHEKPPLEETPHRAGAPAWSQGDPAPSGQHLRRRSKALRRSTHKKV